MLHHLHAWQCWLRHYGKCRMDEGLAALAWLCVLCADLADN
jgi:hypothetical protein